MAFEEDDDDAEDAGNAGKHAAHQNEEDVLLGDFLLKIMMMLLFELYTASSI